MFIGGQKLLLGDLVIEHVVVSEGRMGVTVTFVAILELMREALIDIVQTEPMAPLHVRRAAPLRTLQLVPESAPSEQQESAP